MSENHASRFVYWLLGWCAAALMLVLLLFLASCSCDSRVGYCEETAPIMA